MTYTEQDTESIVSAKELSRREFLALGVAATLPVWLSACQTGTAGTTPSSSPTGATPTKQPSPQASQPVPQGTPSSDDWAKLAKSLQGPLIRPDSSQYPIARQLFSSRFDNVLPAAIAYCASPADVQACLTFLHSFNLPFAIRSGGHSYPGYSTTTGLVIDVTRMNTITVNTGAQTATIGAGARLIDVYNVLAQHGYALPAGSCPTVGIAGLALGGGVGVLGRKLGLTCDSLLSTQIVVADGRMLTCDANHNADLFWSLRGGGGGNFGVSTSFTFKIYPVSTLTIFTLRWPWSSAADVVAAWQTWAPHAPDELWSNCLLQATSDKSINPIIQVNGVYLGGITPLTNLLAQLTNQISAGQTLHYVSGATLLDTMLYEAGCYGKSVNQCHLPTQNAQGTLRRDTASVKSDYYTSSLSRQGINALVNAVSTRHASSQLGDGGIGLDALGGAINRVAANATAFVHRNALFSAQYSGSWNTSDPATVVNANHTWLNNTWQAMRPFASGGAYQNYIDPDLANWQQAYYGANLTRLRQVKTTYDPQNFFHFQQSIPT